LFQPCFDISEVSSAIALFKNLKFLTKNLKNAFAWSRDSAQTKTN